MDKQALKFYYFYKTTNKMNGKFYYGIHSTTDLADGYIGSGSVIAKAISKYGKHNFQKDIIKYFDSPEQMYEYEKQSITPELIRNKKCYNITEGGRGTHQGTRTGGASAKIYWQNAPAEIRKRHGLKWLETWGSWSKSRRKRFATRSKGYNNPSFVQHWKPIFELIKNYAIELILHSNLSDKEIVLFIHNEFGHKVKFHKLIKYYIFMGYLPGKREIRKYKEFAAWKNKSGIQTVKKTIFKGSDQKTIYKRFIPLYVGLFDKLWNTIKNPDCSDSMAYSRKNHCPQCRVFRYNICCKYFEYCGILKKTKIKMINIRKLLPHSFSKHGKKTNFILNKEFNGNTIFYGEKYEKYSININGESIQVSRI